MGVSVRVLNEISNEIDLIWVCVSTKFGSIANRRMILIA
jgi:hypothetical protein